MKLRNVILLIGIIILVGILGYEAYSIYQDSVEQQKLDEIVKEHENEKKVEQLLTGSTLIKRAYRVNQSDPIDQYVWTWKIVYYSGTCEVVGYICVPKDYGENLNQAQPCIILNRGGYGEHAKLEDGRAASYSYAFHSIVFASQYRGVDGGTGMDQIGGEDVNDVIRLIDIASSYSIVDRERLYMIGFSRGGMMTYQALRFDERIKKAIVICGMSDARMSYEERKDWHSAFKERVGGTPKEVPDSYEKRSAVCWADEINTPILLIHGKGDQNVSFEQSQKMYEELIKAGKVCQFRKREDDVHGLIKSDLPTAWEWLGLDGIIEEAEEELDLKL